MQTESLKVNSSQRQSDESEPTSITELFSKKRNYSSAIKVDLEEAVPKKRMKCDSTPQQSKANVIVDRSAISEDDYES